MTKAHLAGLKDDAQVGRRLLPWIFGFAPVFLMLMTWANHGATWRIKVYAIPIAVVELGIVAVALLSGMRIRATPITAILALLLVEAWVTAIFAPDTGKAYLMTALWTLHALFGFAAARLFRPDDLAKAVLAGFVASAAALAIFMATAPSGTNWIGELPGLGNPRMFGIYAAVAIGLSLGLLRRSMWLPLAIMTLGFTLIFWSGSRGAFAAVAAGGLICTALFRSMRGPKIWLPFIASAALGALIAFLVRVPVALVGVTRMADQSDNGRFDLWRRTIEFIGDRPWFGYGEGQTEHLTQIIWTFHPHNIVLQISLAWGFVGLALTSVLAIGTARQLLRSSSEQTLPLICALAVLACYSLVDGTIYNVHSAALFAAFVGVALASGQGAGHGSYPIGKPAIDDNPVSVTPLSPPDLHVR